MAIRSAPRSPPESSPAEKTTHGFPEQAVARGERESPERIFRRVLVRRRLHYTRERIEVLREVLRTHDHFDANELYKRLQRRKARISKATVYRTVALLSECRILREVFHSPQGARYEHVYGHEHHEHMICLACGKVIEFSSPGLERIQEKACRESKFEPVRHHLEILGYCQRCRVHLGRQETDA
jgi:Fur family transcriptional regulator, ferric uptake regulator